MREQCLRKNDKRNICEMTIWKFEDDEKEKPRGRKHIQTDNNWKQSEKVNVKRWKNKYKIIIFRLNFRVNHRRVFSLLSFDKFIFGKCRRCSSIFGTNFNKIVKNIYFYIKEIWCAAPPLVAAYHRLKCKASC